MDDVRRDGATIAFESVGERDRPAILLLHSLGTTSDMWSPQIAPLADRWRVIRCDMRGHGRSSIPAGPSSIAQLAGDAIAVLDASDVGRALVCGLSIGGLIAMWLARYAADRVERLVLANTGARIGTAATWAERIRTVEQEGMQALATGIRGRWFTEGFAERRPDVIAAFQRTLTAIDPRGYVSCCAAIRDADLTADLGRIAAPTLVIAGARDPATTVEHAAVLRDGIPGARCTVLETAHLSNVEEPEAFTSAVAAFAAGGHV